MSDENGAIDHDWDDAERDAETLLLENRAELRDEARDHTRLGDLDVAIDIVSRQTVYILEVVADSLPEYYEQEEFDLYNYKMHPYLPVQLDDTVYKVVYAGGLDGLHKFSDTYDFPAGRLARIPVEMMARGDA